MTRPIVDVTGRVARLFQQPPQEFVAHRNELARDLARAGQRELSTRIKGLARPPVSAWVVNQLYWHERAEYDALLAAGAAARDAQQSRLSGRGGDLARALAERDAIIDRLSRQAERLAGAAGVTLSRDIRSRVRTTLEAIALRAGDSSLVHGQLTDDVPLPGLQALAGLVAADQDAAPVKPARPALALVPSPERGDEAGAIEALAAELDELREVLEAARASAADAQERADEHAGAATAAEQQASAALRALETARQRLAQAQDAARAAAARAAEASGEAEKASAEVEALVARERELLAKIEALGGPAPRTPAPKKRRVSRKR